MKRLLDPWNSNKRPSKSFSFTDWGPPPHIIPVPVNGYGTISLQSLADSYTESEASYGPSMVIGLGDSGIRVLEQWLAQVAEVSPSSLALFRVLAISTHPLNVKRPYGIELRQLVLEKGSVIKGGNTQNRRFAVFSQFRDATTFRQFHEWAQGSLLSLPHGIQAFILASAEEPEISLVGPVLQVLRLLPGDTNPYLNVTVLLALYANQANKGISSGESYSALREIGRFTFGGLHKMPEMPGMKGTVVRSALIDHLLLFDEERYGREVGFSTTELKKNPSQAISESLFAFCHPSARPFWENLLTDAGTSGKYRHEAHEPVADSVGIRTIYVPLSEIQDYLAIRLARAVIFGEAEQDVRYQFTSPTGIPVANDNRAELFARSWLIDKGPNTHPIFEWIWTIQRPQDLRSLPDFSYDFKELYGAKVSHAILRFLSDPGELDGLPTASLVVKKQEERFSMLLDWAQQLRLDTEEILNRQRLIDMLAKWKMTANVLGKSLSNWQHVLSRSAIISAPEEKETSWPENRESSAWNSDINLQSDWSDFKVNNEGGSSAIHHETLPAFLNYAQTEAKNKLLASARDRIRMSFTEDAQDLLREVDLYYSDTVRPELSHYGLNISPTYKSMRERLAWWIKLEPSREPELLLVCWPGNMGVEAGAPPPVSACFSCFDIEKLANALMDLAVICLHGIKDDLTGVWFRNRIKRVAPELQQSSEEVFLNYDPNFSNSSSNPERRRYYLVAHNKSLTGEFRKVVFPNRMPFELNELEGGDPARFTSIAIRTGIPFSSINRLREWYASYNHLERYHLFPQEQLAAKYEALALRKLGLKALFPPDLTLLLADGQLVTLFCQALICRMISLQSDETGQLRHWALQPVGDFAPLPLTDNPSEGLIDAFRRFTLELPNDPHSQYNPHNHFHSNQRKVFLKSLRIEAEEIRRKDFKKLQDDFNQGILAEWKARGEHDALAHAFSIILELELGEPVWSGWPG
jgi:hypothetical protein